MRRHFLSHLVIIPLLGCCLQLTAADKPSLFVLADIGGDPDDQMSMVQRPGRGARDRRPVAHDQPRTIWRWREACQNDFAARMDWTIKPYKAANHPPVVKWDHAAVLQSRAGQRLELSATASSDPDGDPLSFAWFCYEEPGTRRMSNSSTGGKHDIVGFDQPKASRTVKTNRVMAPGTGTMHIILAITDHGTPRLTRYARVIVDVVP